MTLEVKLTRIELSNHGEALGSAVWDQESKRYMWDPADRLIFNANELRRIADKLEDFNSTKRPRRR